MIGNEILNETILGKDYFDTDLILNELHLGVQKALKQKETQNFLVGLKVSDLIITQSGILGRITNLTDTVATIEVANGVQIKVLRSQIATSQEFLKTNKA